MKKIKAVIFDLNGVFIKSPKLSDRFEKDFGVSQVEFLPILKTIMAKVRMPKSDTFYSYWKPYLQTWNINFTEKEFYDYCLGAEKENSELIEHVKNLKSRGIKIFALSNNYRERAEYYKKNFDFLNLFDKIYYSWQTGFVKPNKKAYEKLANENDLDYQECIYFDDSAKNIEVARNLGINAYLFNNETELIKEINKCF